MIRRLAIALLGCGGIVFAAFCALAIYGYIIVHASMPHRAATIARAEASKDPRRAAELLSRNALASVMPPAPSDAPLLHETYAAGAYCLDACPQLERTYRSTGAPEAACSRAIAIHDYYFAHGYRPFVYIDKLPPGLPASERDCRAAHEAGEDDVFETVLQKDTGPKTRSRFNVKLVLSHDRLSITTKTF